MTRRKGELTPARIDRENPFQVEIAMPPEGFGTTLFDMTTFCHAHRLTVAPRGRTVRRNDRDFVRWCFADPTHADAFAPATVATGSTS